MSVAAAAAAKSLQLCPTLCDPIDGSPLGSPIPGILQARTLKWVAISFSNAWKWKVKVKLLSHFNCVLLVATPWTAAYHAPPSMGFSRQEYWSGVPLPSMLVTIKQLIEDRLWVVPKLHMRSLGTNFTCKKKKKSSILKLYFPPLKYVTSFVLYNFSYFLYSFSTE